MIASISAIVERRYTFEDAVAAAQTLREISAGHQEAAAIPTCGRIGRAEQ